MFCQSATWLGGTAKAVRHWSVASRGRRCAPVLQSALPRYLCHTRDMNTAQTDKFTAQLAEWCEAISDTHDWSDISNPSDMGRGLQVFMCTECGKQISRRVTYGQA